MSSSAESYVIVGRADGTDLHAAWHDGGRVTSSRCFKGASKMGRTIKAQVVGDQGILDYAGPLCADCLGNARAVVDGEREVQERLDREGRAAGQRIAVTVYVDVPKAAIKVSVADVRKAVEGMLAQHNSYVRNATVGEATVVEPTAV